MYAIKDKHWDMWITGDMWMTARQDWARKFRTIANARLWAKKFRKTYPRVPVRVVAWPKELTNDNR